MMNFLMMATSQRKPKRHIGNMPYQSKQKGNRHVRMPAFKMPKFKVPKFRMPKPIKYPTTFSHLGSTKKPTGTKLKTNYSPSKSPKSIKLEYSGWQPIGQNTYSPEAPAEAEPEIITIHNAHRHPKKYEVPALPTGTYAPEPITAKPEPKEPKPEVVYGVPEIAVDIQPVEVPKVYILILFSYHIHRISKIQTDLKSTMARQGIKKLPDGFLFCFDVNSISCIFFV